MCNDVCFVCSHAKHLLFTVLLFFYFFILLLPCILRFLLSHSVGESRNERTRENTKKLPQFACKKLIRSDRILFQFFIEFCFFYFHLALFFFLVLPFICQRFFRFRFSSFHLFGCRVTISYELFSSTFAFHFLWQPKYI